ncbi:probable potassium transport system protein kup [Methylocaldum marinum]|uniref:Probable potassium transport system protein Kup n=1 Tax=Methylocaldum marinum TaxID=1432792 RepID=A0A250KVC8_9GAMM|nr:potassium transporter Kup [Methylocaldum marinum]BBA33739.1 probable potassium transport system protein kup [Methylocaldum marinum]
MNSTALAPSHPREHKSLVIAALGIVFGDIGTSPLYTLKQCFGGFLALEPTPENVLGVLSLIFWAVLTVISLKYVIFIMRADNNGEGGIMALISLVQRKAEISPGFRSLLIGLGLIGASLFYGDGMITPAISVLSAVEGLEVFRPELHSYVIPIALAILIGLFTFQRKGTAGVGALFGPIMAVWFFSLAAFGIINLISMPAILEAINPIHAMHFFMSYGWSSIFILGAVVLAVTGGEALYADMGHFGRQPIRKAWFLFVWPSLMLNYFGQGALLIQDSSAVQNPFFLLIPSGGALVFMIGLATLATIIASQAVISGTFSLTSQAIQLRFCPRLGIQYTSEEEKGQIYVPWINWALMTATIGLILGFQTSSNLAAAYGIAVTGTMAIDTILAFVVVYSLWKWNPFLSGILGIGFLTVDLSFLAANAIKIFEGGWFPLVIGLFAFTFLTTWKRGRDLLRESQRDDSLQVNQFLSDIAATPPLRVAGTAVFMTSSREGIPPALLHNLKHNKVLHETVVLMTVTTENIPRVPPEKRREIHRLSAGFFRINLHYGFLESPNIPRVLKSSSREFEIDISDTTFFLSRETIIPGPVPKMPLWRLKLFIGMSRNTSSAVTYFRIPADRVVELGVQRML